MNVTWPNSHKFAFTVFDDTDWATIDNVKPVYDLLNGLGIRITKSVWVYEGGELPTNTGATCEDPAYVEWLYSLRRNGFEIGLHNAAAGTSPRKRTESALDQFRELFGSYPAVHCNHDTCRENIYWGDARVSSWRRTAYNLVTRGRRRNRFRGHVQGDPLFWGDLCRERITYVRNFVFDDLNTLGVCPHMPYYDPSKPYVNFWFASADGGDLALFLANFTHEKIDRLVDEGGLCIAYVHFAARYTRNGVVDPEFRQRMEYIASKDGWFAPVSEVLDYLRQNQQPSDRIISPKGLARLETKWLTQRLRSAAG
jgi:hypothetical protein